MESEFLDKKYSEKDSFNAIKSLTPNHTITYINTKQRIWIKKCINNIENIRF